MYTHIYVAYTHIHMYMHIYIHAYIPYIYIYVVLLYVYIYHNVIYIICIRVYVYTHIINIHVYIHTCVVCEHAHVHVHVHIRCIYLKGFAPCRRPLKLDESMKRFLVLLACCGCFACFSCYMACLSGSISAAWHGFGSHFGGLGDILGMGRVPDRPGDRTMGWIALPLGREHCFPGSRDPGHGPSGW